MSVLRIEKLYAPTANACSELFEIIVPFLYNVKGVVQFAQTKNVFGYAKGEVSLNKT